MGLNKMLMLAQSGVPGCRVFAESDFQIPFFELMTLILHGIFLLAKISCLSPRVLGKLESQALLFGY